MSNPSAGIGDPYWYEWSVGLTHIIELLNPDSDIETVTLQSSRYQGLDDIIVDLRSGGRRCIQIKHTRVGNTLTFGSLLSVDEESETDQPLLGYLASAWKEAVSDGRPCTAELYTNRSAGRRASRTRGDAPVARPPLSEFWPRIKAEIERVDNIDDIQVPSEWRDGWAEWLAALSHLGPQDQLAFLKALSINADQPELDELEQQLLRRLEELFYCSRDQATQLLAAFDHALRRWTVSTRSRASIDAEAVSEALTLGNEPVGTAHLLAPPEPFFSSRNKLLDTISATANDRSIRVALLTGGPGCGKTSVMSKLANTREPLVDIRFHAYRPITPDTIHLPPDADIDLSRRGLWGTLLSQLRHLLIGRLFEYQVPVRNALLDDDQLRAAVLRLASRIGTERKRPFVIAIDGLDHAARAGRPQALELLASIPHPNEVPAGAFILLGGQPPEVWRQYPLWLRSATENVKRIDVPPLDADDIRTLIQHVAPSLEPIDVVATIVAEVSQGDTLSAVFAVQEAKLSESVTALQARLAARKLHSGLQAYYDSIWTSSTERLATPGQLIAFRLAAALSMLDSRVTGELLDHIYQTPALGPTEWRDYLLALRPLVVQDANGFRVTHNDVRLFLTAFLRSDPERSGGAASKLADYLLSETAPPESRYRSLFPVLRLAHRASEIPSSYTPQYVVSAWRAGGSLDKLCGQGFEALDEIQLGEWSKLHGVVVSLATLQQLDRTCDAYEYPRGEREGEWAGPPPALPYECQTLPPNAWNTSVVVRMLDDVLRLSASNQDERARGMMRRWFHSMSPPQVAMAIRNASQSPFPTPQDEGVADAALERLGRVAYRLTKRSPRIAIGQENTETRDWALFYDGFADEAANHVGWMGWARALRQVRIYHPANLEDTVRRLASNARWREVAIALRMLEGSRAERSASFQCEAAAWSLLIGNARLIDAWVSPIVADPLVQTRSASDRDDRAISAIATAFVLGWITHREPAAIRDAAMIAYGDSHPNSEARSLLSFLNHAAAIVGRWFRTNEPPVALPTLTELVTRLLGHARHYEMWKIFERAAPALFRLVTTAAMRSGGEHAEAVVQACAEYADSGRHSDGAQYVWEAIRDQGDAGRLRAWVERRFGPRGDSWLRSTGARIKELDLFRQLALRTPGLQELAPKLEVLSRSAVLGYLEADDYGLARSLRWFEKLSTLEPGAWSQLGIDLLAVNKEADEAGHNKLSHRIETAVSRAAAIVGPAALAEFRGLLDPRGDVAWTEITESAWRDGLLKMASEAQLDRHALAAVWSIALGSLSWRHHRDIDDLRSSRKVVEDADQRFGHGLVAELSSTTPLEWAQASPKAEQSHTSHERDAKATELLAQSDALDDDQALAFTTALFSDTAVRRYANTIAARLAQRLVASGNATSQAGSLLSTVLENRENREWPWSYDGLTELIVALCPALTEVDRWRLVQETVARVDRRDPKNVLLLAEDLDILCLTLASDSASCAAGLERHINSQKLWVPIGHEVRLPKRGTTSTPIDWPDFCMDLLLEIISGDSALLTEAALRGLWALVHLNPDTCGEIARRATALPRDVRELLLQMVERLAVANVALARRFQDFISANEQSQDLECEIQAWIARNAIARCEGEATPPAPALSDRGASQEVILPPERIVVRENESPTLMMRSTTGDQAVASILNQLESTMLIDAELLERRYLASLRAIALDSPKRAHWARGGDSQFVGGGEVSRALNIVRSALPERKDVTFWVRLAQAVLVADEPAALYGPWSVMTDFDWPIGERLDRLLKERSDISRAAFREFLWSGIAQDQWSSQVLRFCTPTTTMFASLSFLC